MYDNLGATMDILHIMQKADEDNEYQLWIAVHSSEMAKIIEALIETHKNLAAVFTKEFLISDLMGWQTFAHIHTNNQTHVHVQAQADTYVTDIDGILSFITINISMNIKDRGNILQFIWYPAKYFWNILKNQRNYISGVEYMNEGQGKGRWIFLYK